MRGNEVGETSRRNFLKKTAAVSAAGVAGACGINVVAPTLFPEKMVFEKNRSFWANALPAANPPLTQDLAVDVAIIGGGFTGLSAAYYLKKILPSQEVAVLEAERCGNGASARNGAMMLTMTDDRFMVWSGEPELDKRIYELTVDNIRRLERLSAEIGLDADIEQNGALQVFNTKRHAEAGREYFEKIKPQGLPFEYWDRAKVFESIGTNVYEGGLFDPGSGQLHPGKLVALFKAAAEAAGARIFEGTTVVHVEEDGQLRLTTADGKTVRANAVILATNAFTSKLGYLRRVVAPFFDYVGITAPLSDATLAATGWRKRIPFNDSRTEVFYLGLTKDGRIHIGGGLADYEFNNGVEEPARAKKRYEELRAELQRIYPNLAGVPFEVCWSGAVDMSLDQTPAVGQMGKHGNIFYALGFSGHGVNLTSVFGRVLADLIAGHAAEWSWLPYLNRLPPYMPNEPFRWLGTQIATEYYRLSEFK
jgi:gamma-glutamylputrescine oxidase